MKNNLAILGMLLLCAMSIYLFFNFELESSNPEDQEIEMLDGEKLKDEIRSTKAKIRGIQAQNQLMLNQIIDALKVDVRGDKAESSLEILHYKIHIPEDFNKIDDLKVLKKLFKEFEEKNTFLTARLNSN